MGCWSTELPNWYKPFQIILDVIELSVPILPIIISCLTCTLFIIYSQNLLPRRSPGDVIKQRCTITILIVTFVYLIFNVPVFINWVFYAIVLLNDYPYPDDTFYNSTVMYYYSWSFTKIVSVTLNSSINPIIYFFRMRRFRYYLRDLFVVRSSRVYPEICIKGENP